MKILFMLALLFSSAPAYSANRFVVKDIRFDGLHRVGLMTALFSIPISLGDTVTDKEISDIIRALFATGNFEDIRILRDKETLLIRVKESPTISNITFSGNKSAKQEILKKRLEDSGIRVGELLNRVMLSNIERELSGFYDSIGKYNANIKTVIIPMPHNCVWIKLVFQEGVSTKIQRINISGNRAFKNKELIPTFFTNDKMPWRHCIKQHTFQERKLYNDLKILSNHYLNRGYACFNVNSTQIKLTPDKKSAYVTINITEGDRYKFSDVTVKGNLAGFSAGIRNLIKIKTGELYNEEKVTKIEENIKKLLGKHGYIYPNIRTQLEINDRNKTVRIYINIEAGSQFYVRRILFEGNKITQDHILRREMKQMEGTRVSRDLVDQGVDRLNRLGYFDMVSVSIQHVSNHPDQVDLLYKVREKHTGSFNFGINYGTGSGITFQTGIHQNNWLGTGYAVSIDSNKNSYQTRSEFSITNPYFTVDGVGVGIHLFYDDLKPDCTGLPSYTNKSYGLDNTIDIPIDEYNVFRTVLGYVHNNVSTLQPQVAMWRYLNSMGKYIGIDSKETNFSSDDLIFSYGWIYNRLNFGLLPTKGSVINLNGKMSIPGSDNKFYKIALNTASYFPLDQEHRWIVLLRTCAGYGDGLKGKEMPFYENFRAGGIGTIRGFRPNIIGPKAANYADSCMDAKDVFIENNKRNFFTEICNYDYTIGGNAMSVSSLEFIMPTSFIRNQDASSIRTSFFVDAGTVWDSKRKNSSILENNKVLNYRDSSNIRISAGVSLQCTSPLGPLVFSYAYPIKKYDGDKIERFQFNIGKYW